MKNVLGIKVPLRLLNRPNDDFDDATAIVAMISALVKLRYSEECGGLINHPNFVEIPSFEFFEKEIAPGLCAFLEMPEERLMNLVETVYLPVDA